MRSRKHSNFVFKLITTMVALLGNAQSATASSAFELSSTANPIELYPRMSVLNPISISVTNITKKDLPDLSFDLEGGNRASVVKLMPSTASRGDCTKGQTLSPGSTCYLHFSVSAKNATGLSYLQPRVCAYGGFWCSRAVIPLKIAKKFTIPLETMVAGLDPQSIIASDPNSIALILKNSSQTLPITGVEIADDRGRPINAQLHSTVITKVQNNCGNKIAPGATCMVTAIYTPPSTGDKTLGVSISYNEGKTIYQTVDATPPKNLNSPPLDDKTLAYASSPVKIENQGRSTTVPSYTNEYKVVGTASPIPPLTKKGKSYPVSFEFTNLGDKDITNISTAVEDITPVEDNCTGALKAHSACSYIGMLTPLVVKKLTPTATLNFTSDSHSARVTVPLNTEVKDSGPILNISPTLKLPDTISTNTNAPLSVIFNLENEGDESASIPSLTESSIPGFTPGPSTCKQLHGSLPAHSLCNITGMYASSPIFNPPPPAAGKPPQAAPTLPQSITIAAGGVSATTTTSSTEKSIQTSVSPALPSYLLKGGKYALGFHFKNTSTATLDHITFIRNLPNFSETSNNCDSTGAGSLAANATCEITGTYEVTSRKLGAAKLAVTALYQPSRRWVKSSAETQGKVVGQLYLYATASINGDSVNTDITSDISTRLVSAALKADDLSKIDTTIPKTIIAPNRAQHEDDNIGNVQKIAVDQRNNKIHLFQFATLTQTKTKKQSLVCDLDKSHKFTTSCVVPKGSRANIVRAVHLIAEHNTLYRIPQWENEGIPVQCTYIEAENMRCINSMAQSESKNLHITSFAVSHNFTIIYLVSNDKLLQCAIGKGLVPSHCQPALPRDQGPQNPRYKLVQVEINASGDALYLAFETADRAKWQVQRCTLDPFTGNVKSCNDLGLEVPSLLITESSTSHTANQQEFKVLEKDDTSRQEYLYYKYQDAGGKGSGITGCKIVLNAQGTFDNKQCADNPLFDDVKQPMGLDIAGW